MRTQVDEKKGNFELEYQIRRHGEGEVRWVFGLGEPHFDDQGRIIRMIGTGQDITERKQADETLKTFRYTVDQASEAIQWINRDAEFVYVNEETCRSLGYTHDEMLHLKLWDIDPVTPRDDWDHDWERLEKGEHIGILNFETMHRRKDGSTFPVEIRAQHLWFGGQELLIAVSRDITERKRAEEETARLAEVVRHSRELVNLADMEGRMIFLNEAGRTMLGIEPEQIEKTNILQVIPGHLKSLVENEIMPSLLAGHGWEGDLQYLNLKTGELTDVHAITFLIDDLVTGQHKYLANVSLDISRRRQAEERWLFALEGAGDGVWDWNAQTNKVYFSRQWKSMLGYEEHEIGDALDEWDSRVHPDDRERVYADLNRHLDGKTPVYVNEHRVRCKNGSYKWILDRGKVISRTPDGKPMRVIGTHTDISKRKLAEERYTAFMQNAIDGFLILDKIGHVIEVNDAYMQMLGYSREELLKMHLTDLDAELSLEEMVPLANKLIIDGSMRFETRHRRKDGTVIDVDVSARIQEQGFDHLFVIIRDITERKLAAAALENSLREKEALFRELQHRMKNSLALITSLIALEMERPENAGSSAILGNIKGRIDSMTSLYSLLFTSGTAARVSLDEYIELISASLTGTYISGMSAITIEKKCDRIFTDAKSAGAWGLIANELLTNALKYAFPPGVAGVIRIGLRKTDDGIELAVSDNGAGPGADFDIDRPEGFGLVLVKMLARQLGGTFTFERGRENVFSVHAPVRGPVDK
jgi:PAS domain S-box-containing protein